ncbi:flagellar biosynthesis protein FlhF [Alicyclobacillus sp. SO9]|uniref:flagellar biosynthesis protein FlhF n=1 Tax=Alicyclobacillus sp. SO9 TaxID=2665646 RepID=UPI0018E6F1DB|nr:flagellar biosynthesis protein FlhF [Alicyclobacillus sp. SO9]QQE80822.1 flagellar biosynthesis protein FlhF [Alicyclobacillus sp. SO9]
MMVKRYVVKDMPEAIVMIRRDLGKDAVILSTRQVHEKHWLGLRRKKRLEVLAAAGEDMPIQTKYSRDYQSVPKEPPAAAPAPVLVSPSVPAGVEGDSKGSSVSMSQQQENIRAYSNQEKILSSTEEHTAQLHGTAVNQFSGPSLQLLQQELMQVRETLNHLVQQSSLSRVVTHENSVAEHTQFLRRQGLESDRLLSALEVVWGQNGIHDGSNLKSAVSSSLLNSIKEVLPQCTSHAALSPSSRVVAFVGQTGVGKTTTIAKIAALQMLSGKKRVGLITADTFRIAAIDQLHTYARILGVPLEVINSAEDMDGAIAKLADRDLILIDTAGRSFRSPEHLEDIRRLLELPVIDETHLVLSLTTKAEDLLQCANYFQGLPVDKFLFTKLDETSSYGTALEVLYRYQRPVSYLTNGQNVPDDLEIATLDKLLKLIFEGAA